MLFTLSRRDPREASTTPLDALSIGAAPPRRVDPPRRPDLESFFKVFHRRLT